MSLVVVGLNHRNAPVDLLERMAIPGKALPKALHALVAREHLTEAVVLSTCNRTEVYVRATRFHPGVDDVRHFLAETAGLDPDALADLLYTFHDDAAVSHLFAVAAGLDSMIIGEHEILGQVRESWRAADAEGTAGPTVARAFRQAIEVGKRARTETGIGRHAVSISSAAVALAGERLGTLEGRRVLVIGAGDVGQRMAVALAGAGATEVVIANRTPERATVLAERVQGRAIGLGDLADALAGADVVLSSTSAEHVLVERASIEEAMRRRDHRAMLVVDVAVPRDVDPGVAQVFGVTLLDIDALRAMGEQSLQQRRAEIGRVREIVGEELDRYRLERSAREMAPVVTALRAHVEDLRRSEVARAGTDPALRDALDAATRALVNKLLHEPTVRLKQAAGTDRGELFAEALAELFALPPLTDEG